MKDKSSTIIRTLFMLMVMLLVLPFIQSTFHIAHLKKLKGYYESAIKPVFNLKTWFSAEFQNLAEKYLNENFGFRSEFVRINNQIAFSFFNKAKAQGVIIGKNNFLYEENYIKAFYGKDFIGYDSISNRIERLKFIQDTLSKLNKTLIIVFAAGKASYYPEYIPDEYKTGQGPNNYQTHIETARTMGLQVIDFNRYFLKQKYISKYPLYPQYGIHWSYYGQCLAADSIIGYIESLRNIDMPDMYWNKIIIKKPQKEDMDIADGMNLIFKPNTFKMAYPQIQFEPDSGKTKPSVVVIADSFYWGMFNFGISQVFSESHFWFYNQQIYPESYQSPLVTSQVNLAQEIANHDIFIIMATEATLPGFGWGFIENVYHLFSNHS